ncbi:MAG: hypothetical protein KC431_19320, partial [Myxococcales bacterium]|nr:hypothetical protein [Myxococcales bacterium]
RTFFRYYATKDALLFVDNSDHLERFRELLALRQVGDTAFGPVRRACIALAESYMSDHDQVIARARIIESSPALSKQERQQDLGWEQAIAEALLDSVREPSDVARRRGRLLAGAIWGVMRASMEEWTRDSGRRDLVWLTREALSLFDSAVTLELEPRTPRVDN